MIVELKERTCSYNCGRPLDPRNMIEYVEFDENKKRLFLNAHPECVKNDTGLEFGKTRKDFK